MKKLCYIVTMPMAVRHFWMTQLNALAKSGWDVTVVCNPDPTLQQELGEAIRFYPIEIPRGVKFKKSLRALKEMRRFFRMERFDVIQYSSPNASFCAAIASKQSKCKVRIYHLSGFRYLSEKGLGRFALKTIERINCFLSTSVELDSVSNLELGAKERIFRKSKAIVLGNGTAGGVDLHRFDLSKRDEWRRELRKQLGYAEDDFVFGFAGRITRDKGINELLDAMENTDGRAKLLLVGYMEVKPDLENRLEEVLKRDSRIKILPPTREIEKYYTVFDCMVLPSYREGFGNAVAEAGAMGTPAIVSDIPGPIDAVVPQESALLVKPYDASDLAEKMKQMMTADVRKMGECAAAYCRKRFDSDLLDRLIVERKEKLYRQSIYGKNG